MSKRSKGHSTRREIAIKKGWDQNPQTDNMAARYFSDEVRKGPAAHATIFDATGKAIARMDPITRERIPL